MIMRLMMVMNWLLSDPRVSLATEGSSLPRSLGYPSNNCVGPGVPWAAPSKLFVKKCPLDARHWAEGSGCWWRKDDLRNGGRQEGATSKGEWGLDPSPCQPEPERHSFPS